MLTDNNILTNRVRSLPTLMCAQRKAEKKVPTEEDFIKSNIESFGNEIGQTTNWITSMFEVMARYEKGSKEHEILDYRIRCGQLIQQNIIDKSKGIICKPMPRSWHDRHAANKIEDADERALYRRIVADKKPYFMRYIYPDLMKQYNRYIKNTNKNCLREFQMTVDELSAVPESERTERQNEFMRYYHYRMPVGTSSCVMNKICRRFEQEFDGFVNRHKTSVSFDYSFMKSGAEYSYSQYTAINRLYHEYNHRLRSYMVFADAERLDKSDSQAEISTMNKEFRRQCDAICPNGAALCNIILDICYTKNSTKRFAWSMCGSEIIHNLLTKNNNTISFPVLDNDGSIKYCGNSFSVKSKKAEVD